MKHACSLLVLLAAGGLLGACTGGGGAAAPIKVGVVMPISGAQGEGGREELAGVDIARQLVDEDGGVAGRPIELVTRDLEAPQQAAALVGELRHAGVSAVIGGYSSALSIPASAAAANQGLVYWETGAVADQVTGRGLPGVFRVGASGANLGSNSGNFAATRVAPGLGRRAQDLSVSLVVADDEYAHSVAAAVVSTVTAAGMRIASTSVYAPAAPQWPPVIETLRAAHPNILVLASHIPDGIAFRRAMLAAGIHVDAFIGSTMAQCMSDFGDALGADAIGVFASDRPGESFDATRLRPQARSLYARFAQRWRERLGGVPSEEGLSGFSAAWVLFHEVLPRAAAAERIDSASMEAAAQALDLPEGSLPNGAGVRFAVSPDRLGQNLRAAAVIWQWQGVRHSVVVWPPEYATGAPVYLPLPR